MSGRRQKDGVVGDAGGRERERKQNKKIKPTPKRSEDEDQEKGRVKKERKCLYTWKKINKY